MYESSHVLVELVAAADRAYQRARVLVLDRLAPGEQLNEAELDPRQRRVLHQFRAAEQELADYRARTYGSGIMIPEQVAAR